VTRELKNFFPFFTETIPRDGTCRKAVQDERRISRRFSQLIAQGKILRFAS
jgi:hypothetical protein